MRMILLADSFDVAASLRLEMLFRGHDLSILKANRSYPTQKILAGKEWPQILAT